MFVAWSFRGLDTVKEFCVDERFRLFQNVFGSLQFEERYESIVFVGPTGNENLCDGTKWPEQCF
jgi:hypothetical protein